MPDEVRGEPSRATLEQALRDILFLRPGGPCRNKLVEQMENIARDALENRWAQQPSPPKTDPTNGG